MRPPTPGELITTVGLELGEMALATLLQPLGSSARGNAALVRLVVRPPGRPAALHRTPVVLVHGYGGSRANWLPLERELARQGFANVHAVGYHAFGRGLPALGQRLVADCRAVMHRAGSGHVHLVGHSLGGVIVRYAIQELGLGEHVRTAVTAASPHAGTDLARFGCGGLAVSLRPGSRLLEGLRAGAGADRVRWIACYSDRDLVVPVRSARLDDDVLRARNVLVPGVGHLGILRAPGFLACVVRHLLDAERPPAATPPRETASELPATPLAG
jgi:pimeloyl-ACP methyl ester carboxylesterase